MEKVLRWSNLGDPDDDLEFWLTQPPIKRLEALEALRAGYISFYLSQRKDVHQGLQRTGRFVERDRS